MSRKPESATSPPSPASEEQVIAHLRAHPDFFARHCEILNTLVPPSRFNGDPVVDMQQFMIGRLNQELEQLRGCAEHLITTSRSNMSTQSRTHQAVLALLDGVQQATVARVVAEDLPTLLDVDLAIIGFETAGDPAMAMLPGAMALPDGIVGHLLGTAEHLLMAEAEGDPAIFGDGAGLVASFALVRLSPCGGAGGNGLLALGSRHQRAFHSGQGTELLGFLARVIDHCVGQCRL